MFWFRNTKALALHYKISTVLSKLRPLINTCQSCSASPANHEPCLPANGVIKIQVFVCKRFFHSSPLPYPYLSFLGPRPIFGAGKIRKLPFLGLSLLPSLGQLREITTTSYKDITFMLLGFLLVPIMAFVPLI